MYIILELCQNKVLARIAMLILVSFGNASETKTSDRARSSVLHATNPRRNQIYAWKAGNSSRPETGKPFSGQQNEH